METHDVLEVMPETLTPELQGIVDALKDVDVDVELCGSWLWISGDTRPHKELLKGLKCRWSRRKARWYYCPEKSRKGYFGKRREVTMPKIRLMYGSEQLQATEEA